MITVSTMLEINKVYNADCLETMKLIDDKSIDMILCDLPYQVTNRNIWDIIIPFDKMWEAYSRIIKDDGAIVLTATQPFASKLTCSNLELFKYNWIWKKSTKTNFLNAKKQPLRQHEQVLIFYKSQPTYNPQGLKQVNKFTKQGKTETTNYGQQDRRDGGYFQENGGYPSDILEIKSQSTRNIVHPTQKPVELFEYFIKTYTNEGDLVLDNCAGSFTTAVAAINTKRNWICIEKEANYCEIGQKRIQEATDAFRIPAK